MAKPSAGLLMYRKRGVEFELLLVHPGGPFWKNKDDGAWSIPKGEIEEGETDPLEVAKREFEEETRIKPVGRFESLGSIKRKDGKIVYVWAFEGDCDPSKVTSNTILIDWPPRSGKKLEVPEVDRAGFFTIEEAKKKLVSYQIGIVEAFENLSL